MELERKPPPPTFSPSPTASPSPHSSPRARKDSGGADTRTSSPFSSASASASAPQPLPPKRERRGPAARKKLELGPPQLIQHLPRAEEEALAQFEELKRNWYQTSKLGRSKGQEEGMVCECRYTYGEWA